MKGYTQVIGWSVYSSSGTEMGPLFMDEGRNAWYLDGKANLIRFDKGNEYIAVEGLEEK